MPNQAIGFHMPFIRCTFPQHGAAIQAIFNDAIATSTVLYDYEPRSLETIEAWFASKEKGGYPLIGWVDEEGFLEGFASYGQFRPHAAYKYSMEHSVYVEKSRRGRGLGRRLLREVIRIAESEGVHVLVGGVDADNAASIQLHLSEGFVECARFQQIGFKFGRWLDAVFYQKVLSGPLRPTER